MKKLKILERMLSAFGIKYKYYMKRVNPADTDKIIEKASDLLNDIRNKQIFLWRVI